MGERRKKDLGGLRVARMGLCPKIETRPLPKMGLAFAVEHGTMMMSMLISFSTHQRIPNEKTMTEILVLSTLHQLHGQLDYYTYDHLSHIITSFAPEVLAVELTPDDLHARKPQRVKQEYQQSVYPLLDALGCETIPLEPAEPLYSELVGLGKKAMEDLQKRNPAAVEQFGLYVNALYDVLFNWWRSPLDVNSSETDRHFEIKHRYQNEVFGEDEEKGWELWNQHFLEQILAAAAKYPEGRILVLVGAEHSYWLRKHLREQPAVRLLAAEEALSSIG